MTEMRQFVPENATIIGEPPSTDASYNNFCPKCGALLGIDEEGYGFAGGGGMGSYIFCPSDDCDWFYKWIHAPEEA